MAAKKHLLQNIMTTNVAGTSVAMTVKHGNTTYSTRTRISDGSGSILDDGLDLGSWEPPNQVNNFDYEISNRATKAGYKSFTVTVHAIAVSDTATEIVLRNGLSRVILEAA